MIVMTASKKGTYNFFEIQYSSVCIAVRRRLEEILYYQPAKTREKEVDQSKGQGQK